MYDGRGEVTLCLFSLDLNNVLLAAQAGGVLYWVLKLTN